MEANLANLKKAMELCATAHRAELTDWSEEGQLGINNDNLPTTTDVRSICKAFFGSYGMVDTNWGYNNVYVYDKPFLPEVDMMYLELALPCGWVEKIEV